MVELTQTDLKTGKYKLDLLIKEAAALTEEAELAYILACRAGEYDMRENLLGVASEGHKVLAALYAMRAYGGRIEGGNITRAGGT